MGEHGGATGHAGAHRRWLLALVGLALALLCVRVVFLLLSPFELAADEAHYWEWSRRLDLSYYSKGPGVAYTIALATALLGDAEWAIRTPAAVFGSLSVLLMGGLAWSCAVGSRTRRARIALYAGVALCAVPFAHAIAVFMTIDGPYVACWIGAAWAGWALARRAGTRGAWLAAAALGVVLGAGFLFKYTILLLAIGMVGYALFAPRRPRDRRARGPVLLAGVVFAIVASPVAIWNAQHDWPTVRHLLGHLGAPGGDIPSSPALDGDGGAMLKPLSTLEFIATQLGIVGPALVLMGLSIVRTRRRPSPVRLYLIWCAAPILVFYLVVSVFADAEANWPIAGYTTLLALVAIDAPAQLRLWRGRLRLWRGLAPPRPRAGLVRRAPETPFQVAWHWALVFGGVTFVLILLTPFLARMAIVRDNLAVERISGQRSIAREVDAIVDAVEARTGRAPALLAKRYTTTSLMAYYLDGRPVVRSTAVLYADRPSSYDFFAGTRLDDPAILGGPAVFIGSSSAAIVERFDTSPLRTTTFYEGTERAIHVHAADVYRGPRDLR